MKFLFLNCYDITNPRSGGAEKYTFNIAKRLVDEGHKVVWVSSAYKNAKRHEIYEGIQFSRWGNRLTTLIYGAYYLVRYGREFDYVFDQFHGYPFYAVLFTPKRKLYAFIHEVAGEIWDSMSVFPLNIVGKILEYISIKFLYKNVNFITVSNSTKENLVEIGVKKENIEIVLNGIEPHKFNTTGSKTITKKELQLVSFSGIRRLKRIEDQIEAVDILRKDFSQIKLIITGKRKGKYFEELVKIVKDKDLEDNVEFVGYLNEADLNKLISESYLNLGTSVKEGWGLSITESASLGTPSVCYKVGGYVDSVKHFNTGLITIENNPDGLSKAIHRLIIDQKLYSKLQKNAQIESMEMTWDKSFRQFKRILEIEDVSESDLNEKNQFSNLQTQILF